MESTTAFIGQSASGAAVIGIVCRKPETPAEAAEALRTAKALRTFYGARESAIYFADGFDSMTPEQRTEAAAEALDNIEARAEAEQEEFETWHCVMCDLYEHCERHGFTPCELDAEQSAEERADDLRAAFRR